jgi:hypothetical protein
VSHRYRSTSELEASARHRIGRLDASAPGWRDHTGGLETAIELDAMLELVDVLREQVRRLRNRAGFAADNGEN